MVAESNLRSRSRSDVTRRDSHASRGASLPRAWRRRKSPANTSVELILLFGLQLHFRRATHSLQNNDCTRHAPSGRCRRTLLSPGRIGDEGVHYRSYTCTQGRPQGCRLVQDHCSTFLHEHTRSRKPQNRRDSPHHCRRGRYPTGGVLRAARECTILVCPSTFLFYFRSARYARIVCACRVFRVYKSGRHARGPIHPGLVEELLWAVDAAVPQGGCGHFARLGGIEGCGDQTRCV